MRGILFVITISAFLLTGLIGCSSNTNSANSLRGNFDTTQNGAAGTPANTYNSMNSNKETANSNTGNKDNSFANEAAQGGMAEVQIGQLAVSKTQNSEVKQFAQKMVADHTKANDELKE